MALSAREIDKEQGDRQAADVCESARTSKSRSSATTARGRVKKMSPTVRQTVFFDAHSMAEVSTKLREPPSAGRRWQNGCTRGPAAESDRDRAMGEHL
jgi:hypothetical protein